MNVQQTPSKQSSALVVPAAVKDEEHPDVISLPGTVGSDHSEAEAHALSGHDNPFYGSVDDSLPESARSSSKQVNFVEEDGMKELSDYPPGFSVHGSRNLPIPEVESEYSVQERKRARRKRRKKRRIPSQNPGISPYNVESPEPSQNKPISEAEFVQKALQQPEYTEPAPRVLPPIQPKTAVFAVSTTTFVGPVVPEIDEIEKPKIMDQKVATNSDNEGLVNQSFATNETGFASNKEYLVMKPTNGGAQTKKTDKAYYKRPKTTLHFHDGVRFIDYILAYEEDEDVSCLKSQKRVIFEQGLEEKGLELEREPKEESQDQKTCFVKVHVPWPTRLKYAERMKMKMPIKEDKIEHDISEEEQCCSCGCFRNALKCCVGSCTLNNHELKEKFADPDCYTHEFSVEKLDFFDIQDEETFFSHAEISRMAYRIMSETRYGEKRVDIGITALLSDDVYTAAYPLHEGKFASKESKMDKNANLRRLLYWEWARWGRWYKFQPLDIIRRYFGDKIAIYFAWLGFYSEMLIYPTFVGLIVFIYSIITLWFYDPVEEICDETFSTYAGNLTMCPLCDRDCSYWKLSTSCLAAQITYIFDNEATIFFAVFMSLWATMFLEFWKRRQFKLSYDWDLVDYDEERDLVRPEFEAQVTRERLNPVTGQKEPFLSTGDRYSRTAFSFVTVLFWILVIIAAVFAVIVYRLAINAIFAVSLDLSSLGAIGEFATPSLLTTITASLISLIVIMILNKVYEKVALWLTHMELPRTQLEFEDSFTLKMFCFQFVNYYSFLFYVAFFKSPFAGYPGNYTYLGEWRWTECDAGGCMYELSIQLIIIMLGKQLWNNIVELVWPWMINKYRAWRSKKASNEMPDNQYTRWEQDYDLRPYENMGLFYEYLEMVIQFGFVTLFVAAFPLAPVFALLNNIVEIRLDANKFICEIRRPLAEKCSDIGAWYYLLEFIGTLAVVTNAFTLAITSEALPKLVYYYGYSTDFYPEMTYQGYTENKLSIFNVSAFDDRNRPADPSPFPGEGNVTQCRYQDYRSPPTASPPYVLTMQYWHVIAAKLAFVIVMEHVVFFLKRLLDYLIPDRSRALNDKIRREHFLVRDMIVKAEKEKLKKQLSQNPNAMVSSSKPEENKFFSVENENTPM
ncbi:unnamed protein product [Clavelina lepadiformis]|uniref:Anoctamin n=1 Tax=Clavelina lepadiformis TaxID=159417 RepID=A0ABP0FIL7_CLALP